MVIKIDGSKKNGFLPYRREQNAQINTLKESNQLKLTQEESSLNFCFWLGGGGKDFSLPGQGKWISPRSP